MLEIVARGFRTAKEALQGQTTLTEANIDAALRDVRVSLLEADVELGVTRAFLSRVKERAIGEVVRVGTKRGGAKASVGPGEHFVRICQRELEALMGPIEQTPIVFRRPLTTIMMVGLQGTGKTTTCGKLARRLLAQGRRPLLVAADIARPAAAEQLRVLGDRVGVPVFHDRTLAVAKLCAAGQATARRQRRDVVILDTAGRLAVDDALMAELVEVRRATRPDNIFVVCDAMAGQDSVRTAAAFNQQLDVSGFVLTKVDGDARGGAALSIKFVTGKPIKFLGVGEGVDKLEDFRPEGLASRILGMGDVVGLMKDFEQVVDEKQAERDTRKLMRGQFTLEDFLAQLRALKKVGSLRDILDKMPLGGALGGDQAKAVDDRQLVGMEALIQSMTPRERREPRIIDASRARRIARGAGRKPEAVEELVTRFFGMQQMVGTLAAQPGLMGNLRGLGKLARGGRAMPAGAGGGLPPGLPGAAPSPDQLPPGLAQLMQAAPGRPAKAAKLPNPGERQRQKDRRRREKAARRRSRR